MNTIDQLRKVATHNLTRIGATMDYDRITDTLIVLANTLANTETDEFIWCLGEGDEFTLDSLIVGAYWHFTEWHGGQHSKGYLALCALGEVFSPGMSMPETDNSAYQLLNELAE